MLTGWKPTIYDILRQVALNWNWNATELIGSNVEGEHVGRASSWSHSWELAAAKVEKIKRVKLFFRCLEWLVNSCKWGNDAYFNISNFIQILFFFLLEDGTAFQFRFIHCFFWSLLQLLKRYQWSFFLFENDSALLSQHNFVQALFAFKMIDVGESLLRFGDP